MEHFVGRQQFGPALGKVAVQVERLVAAHSLAVGVVVPPLLLEEVRVVRPLC